MPKSPPSSEGILNEDKSPCSYVAPVRKGWGRKITIDEQDDFR